MSTAELVSDGTISINEALEFLSVSRTELWRLIRSGKLKTLKNGRRVLVPRRELTRFLESLAAA